MNDNGQVYLSSALAEEQPDAAQAAALLYARDLGAQHGRNAASWYFDGNTDRATYATVLAGIEDGDPEMLDTLPTPDLSGQWADSLTGPQLFANALRASGRDQETEPYGVEFGAEFEDICDAYEEAFSQAVSDEIERMARYQIDQSADPAQRKG